MTIRSHSGFDGKGGALGRTGRASTTSEEARQRGWRSERLVAVVGMAGSLPGVAAHVNVGEQVLLKLGKLGLVLVTLLFLSSMGGAMLFGFPVLVPMHWFAARNSGPFAVGGWALLSALSVLEGAWMLSYLASNSAAIGLVFGLFAAVGVAGLFLLLAAERAAAVPPAPK